MDLQKYPNAAGWIESLAQNEQGMMILLLISLGLVAWLIVLRPYPRLMRYARWIYFAAFWVSAIVMVIGINAKS